MSLKKKILYKLYKCPVTTKLIQRMFVDVNIDFDKQAENLSNREKDIIAHITRSFTTKGLFNRVYRYKERDSSYRDSFWWNAVHCSIYVNDWKCYMPRCLSNLRKMIPYVWNEENEKKLKWKDISDIPESKILFLSKRSKKRHDYIKPEELADCAKYIIACSSGIEIKYVFYGSVESLKTEYSNSKKREETPGVKIYPKEIKGFEDGGLKIVDNNCKAYADYHEDVRFIPEYEYMNYSFDTDLTYSGYLFEIPEISKKQSEKIFRELRNKRFKELHLDYQN